MFNNLTDLLLLSNPKVYDDYFHLPVKEKKVHENKNHNNSTPGCGTAPHP